MLLTLVLGCLEPFPSDRHDLVDLRIVGMSAEGGELAGGHAFVWEGTEAWSAVAPSQDWSAPETGLLVLTVTGEEGATESGELAVQVGHSAPTLVDWTRTLSATGADLVLGLSGPATVRWMAPGGTLVETGPDRAEWLPIDADGKLGAATSFQQHVGPRTRGHSINVDKANKFALCCDLGLDKVIIYAFDPAKGTLTPHSEFNTPKGAGPRHFAWHPDGKTAYVNGESDLTIIACDYDADKGLLTQRQVLSTLPKDVARKDGSTAETVVHPSGRFVYVSNRDPYNSIAIFSIDPQTRELKAVGHQAEGIKTPRNFAIEPTGQFMLVANKSGGNVLVFRINQATGELTPTGASVQVPSPVCVRFLELK